MHKIVFSFFITIIVSCICLASSEAVVPSLSPMLKKVMPSIVTISGFKRTSNLESQEMQPNITIMLGAGIIVDSENGYILTNSHVVEGLDEIQITLSDQRKLQGKLLAKDPASDIAIVNIEADNLNQTEFADSDKVEVGDFVVAIGNPYGFNNTVTSGIVSAIGRNNIGLDGYYDFIQTDAAINEGNSGGGLFNLSGQLIGINTGIISTANNSGNIGLGFAIPANMARSLFHQLISTGRIDRGPLGVRVQPLTPELAQAFGVKTNQGAIIVDVLPNTPAADAKLAIGDVILSIDDKDVKDSVHLRTLISLIPINRQVNILLSRNGKRIKKSLVITDPRDKFIKGETIFSGLQGGYFEVDDEGIVLVDVEPNSKIYHSDLLENDIIIAANQESIRSIENLQKIANKAEHSLLLHVKRDKVSFFVAISK